MLRRRTALLSGIALLALCLLLTGAWYEQRDAGAAPAIGWRVLGGKEGPFRLDFTRGGKSLVTQSLGGGGAGPGHGFSYVMSDGAFHTLTRTLSTKKTKKGAVYRVATTDGSRTATVSVSRRANGLRVSFRLVPERGVLHVFEAFEGTATEHFLGTGQRPGFVDLQGTVAPLKVFNKCRSNEVAPFFLSSRGYGIRIDTTSVGMIAFPGGSWNEQQCDLGTAPCAQEEGRSSTRICIKAARLDYEVYAGTPAQIVRAHSASIGRPPLPPPSQFALIKWRDSVLGPQELFDDIRQLQARRIPLGWILLDNPWETDALGKGCYGNLTFDPARYPDPKGMIRKIHSKGVRFMLWVSPQIRNKEGCPGAPYGEGNVVGDDEFFLVDLTKPAARAEFEQKLDQIVALGVDGIKGDRADEVDLEQRTLHAGPGVHQHNRIPVLFAESITKILRKYKGNNFATLNRAAYTGSHRRLHGLFGLDLPHDFRGLQEAVRMAQNAGVSGFPFWGTDIGGFSGDSEITSEVFVRWAQFAALTPVFETGGEGLTSRFWELGKPTVAQFRRAAVLHYELFPYLYELARGAARGGLPIVRPLGFRYPNDQRAWRADQQLLVGDALLAAPVTSGTRRGNDLSGPATRWKVYVPAGRWVDVHRATEIKGPRSITRSTPISELPLYMRAGAAIPFNGRQPAVWAKQWRLNDLNRSGRAGWLYAPGSRATRSPGGRAGTLVATPRGRAIELRVEGGQRETQLTVLARERPCRVTVGGRAVAEADPAALRGRASGWTFRRGSFGGVVVKLTAPARRTVVTFCA